jgi:hypothetical protein
VDDVLGAYFSAWNEPDRERRRAMLEDAVTADVELIDPTGRWAGVDGLIDRIDRYQTAAPETKVVPASGVDSHNEFARYTWVIVDAHGREVMEGLDVVERVDGDRLGRILMFHGPIPPDD